MESAHDFTTNIDQIQYRSEIAIGKPCVDRKTLVVEFAGLGVEGCALLDGAEAGDAEGLTGLGDGCGPAADVLERALASSVGLLGDDLPGLALHEKALLVSGFGLLAGAVPDLAAGSTDSNATGHIRFVRGASALAIGDARI